MWKSSDLHDASPLPCACCRKYCFGMFDVTESVKDPMKPYRECQLFLREVVCRMNVKGSFSDLPTCSASFSHEVLLGTRRAFSLSDRK